MDVTTGLYDRFDATAEDVDEALINLRESIIANLTAQLSLTLRRSTEQEVIDMLEMRLLAMDRCGDLPAMQELVAMMITVLEFTKANQSC